MPHRSRLRASLSALTRCVLLGAVLSGVYVGGASAAFYYQQRQRNAAQSVLPLPVAPRPDSATRLLVFAPHSDDETLGCAGLIQQTVASGGTAKIVILTNGDAFTAAVERQYRRLRPSPADYLQFAALRQRESRSALQSLGVPAENVQFFGFPDGGLMPIWNGSWTANRRYASPTTRCSAAPAALSARPDAIYCGQTLLESIKAAIRACRPTLMTVTHPAEDHADHAAAASFVTLALRELQADPESAAWANRIQLRYYLVHRGDWPVPPASPNAPLAPPAAMTGLDTFWRELPLTPAETERKANAIALYPSQTAMMGRFLTAFARSNEIYGEQRTPRVETISDRAAPLSENAPVWNEIAPALLSPLSDNIARAMEGGGDLAACRICRDSRNLYLQIEMREKTNSRFRVTVRLRAIGPNGESNATGLTLRLTPQSGSASDGTETALRGRILTVKIPLERLAPTAANPTLAFSAETALASVSIDQTGIALLSTN